MMMNLVRIFGICTLALSFFGPSSYAQKFSKILASQQGEVISIVYQIESRNPSDLFQVQVYSSMDNFLNPLNHVSGDIGDGVNALGEKKIQWDAGNALGEYEGDISFELRGSRVTIESAIQLHTSFPKKSRLKRGNKYKISWTGGAPDSRINIDLVQNGNIREPVARNLINSFEYEWKLPRNKVNGKDFQLVIKDLTYSGNQTLSADFNIKTPISPVIKGTFLIAAIVGIYSIIQLD